MIMESLLAPAGRSNRAAEDGRVSRHDELYQVMKIPGALPGAHVMQIHRLVGIFIGLGALQTTIVCLPAIADALDIHQTGIVWLVAFVNCPAILAGMASAIGILLSRRQSTGPSPRPRRTAVIDQVTLKATLAFIVAYGCAAALSAVTPVIRLYGVGYISGRTHPLLALYLVVAAAASILTPRRRLLYYLGTAPLLLMTLVLSKGGMQPVVPKEVGVNLTTGLAALGALSWVLRQASAVDASSAEQLSQAIELATEEARLRAQQRNNSFIHDHVLSALISIANGVHDAAALRGSARTALHALARATQDERRTPLTARALLSALATELRTIAPHVVITCAVTTDWSMTAQVAQALRGASCEAMRNSVRHANPDGGPIQRAAHLSGTHEGIAITIVDDGCGFDPGSRDIMRSGIDGSILARMRDVGGGARITSAPDGGTTVDLHWRPAERDGNGQAPALGDMRVTASRAWAESLPRSMESLGARLISAGFIAVYVMLVAHECYSRQYRWWPGAAAGLVIMIIAGVLLLRTYPDARLPRWAAVLTIAAVGAGHLLVLEQISTDGWPGYAAWCTGVGLTMCCGLLMRRRTLEAWIAFTLMTLTVTYWVLSTNRPLTMVPIFMFGHFFMFIEWQGIVFLSVRASAQIVATERATMTLLADRRAHEEARRLTVQRMLRVRHRVTPLLGPIADGADPTSDVRIEARLLEAELRDEIRAPFFTGTSVVRHARAARRRGADVILLDDSGISELDLIPDVRREAIKHITAVLDQASDGRIVIRVNPPHRPALLTVTTKNANYQLLRNGSLISEPLPSGRVVEVEDD